MKIDYSESKQVSAAVIISTCVPRASKLVQR